MHFYRTYYTKKAEELRAKESALRQELIEANESLQQNPCSYTLQLKAAIVKEQLTELEGKKAVG